MLALLVCPVPASIRTHLGRFLVESWETDDGLPENSATSIVQTPDGYLWFGTFNGLVRFDGVRMAVIDPSNTPGFPGTAIVNLHLDAHSHLWASSENGITRLDRSGWTNIPFRGGLVRSFAENRRGELFAAGFDGGIFKHNNNRFEEIPPPLAITEGYLLAIDEMDRLLASQTQKAWRLEEGRWVDLNIPTHNFRLGQGRAGAAWIAASEGLYKLENGKLGALDKAPFPMRDLWSVSEDSYHNVWVCSFRDGLYVRYADGSWDHFTEGRGLGHNGLRCVTEDQEGNHWIGTSGGGLHRFTPARFSTIGKADGLPERVVKAVISDGAEGLYIGTFGRGVFQWTNGRVRQLGGELDQYGRFIFSLLRLRDGTLLAGTYQRGVMRVDEKSSALFAELGPKDEVFALFEDRDGVLWIGANSGLFRASNGVATPVLLQGGRALANVRAIGQTPQGRILVASAEGIGSYYQNKLALIPEWEFGEAVALHIENDSTFWASAREQGLLRIDSSGVRQFRVEDGVPNKIGAIVPDPSGNLWLASNEGVVRFQLQYNSFLTQWFDQADGLASVECAVGYGSTAVVDPGGGMISFATLKGVARVNTKTLRLNTRRPPVFIESIRIDDASIAVHSPGVPNPPETTVQIPAHARRIEIDYTALSLAAPQKLEFQTRIEGLDPDWQGVETRRTAYLQGLRPGEYHFQVRAANNDRLWNETGASLAFTVQPYLWQTGWFQLSIVGGGSLIIWLGFRGIVRQRVARQVERVREQAALSEVQARLATVLENTSDVVSFATTGGDLLYLNSAGRRLLAIDEHASVSHFKIGDLHPGHARGHIENEALSSALKTGSWQGDTLLLDQAGREVPVSLLILAHRHADGSIDFISTIARDVSDARRSEETRAALEKQLRAAQKMEALGTLAGGIAHDFNNILTGILGNAELLKFTLPDGDSNRAQAEHIVRAASRARDLIKQMLTFGRPQENGQVPTRIWPTIQEATILLRASIPAAINIEAECQNESAVIQADPIQIHQVIMNLGANAAHAMAKDGGTLQIRQETIGVDADSPLAEKLLKPGRWVKISVADTGHGMKPEILERIFEPFFTTKAPGQGTGLGLSVVHGIVRAHGGVVIARSWPEAGTTFELYFPLASAPEAKPFSTAPSELPRGAGQQILLVDDEPLVLDVARNYLSQLGYTCKSFEDAVEALIHFQSHSRKYDLLLTDFSMPRLSGIALAKAVHDINPALPIIITTGYSGRIDPSEAQKAGVLTILSKPYQMEELARALHSALGKSGSHLRNTSSSRASEGDFAQSRPGSTVSR